MKRELQIYYSCYRLALDMSVKLLVKVLSSLSPIRSSCFHSPFIPQLHRARVTDLLVSRTNVSIDVVLSLGRSRADVGSPSLSSGSPSSNSRVGVGSESLSASCWARQLIIRLRWLGVVTGKSSGRRQFVYPDRVF